jgi:FKBP-type peptidyl-prolyl cis-trans isomerase SlyD
MFMLIKDNMVVSIHYTLKNEEGQVLDSSQGREPLSYLHGNNNIIPGLENALTGKEIGEQFNISIPPEDGYGVRDERLIQVLPKTAFEGIDLVEPGMQFQARSDQGVQIITVTSVDGDRVTVDGNHALAGEVLNFDIEITHIRPATEEELAHGHVHGPGGNHH